MAVAISVLALVLSYAMSGRMGFGLFPTIESDRSEASLVMPYGSPVAKTEAIMQRLLKGAQQVVAECGHPELVKEIVSDIGREGGHTGRMRVELADVRNGGYAPWLFGVVDAALTREGGEPWR